jgi:DNA invertase Pin-like site-specific DNA recombinase
MKAGLSIRNIATGTGIPVTSVHRAMRAIARAQAKQEVAVLGIMETLIVTRLDRLACSTRDLLNVLHEVGEGGRAVQKPA